jgi:dienelactone hydrolase
MKARLVRAARFQHTFDEQREHAVKQQLDGIAMVVTAVIGWGLALGPGTVVGQGAPESFPGITATVDSVRTPGGYFVRTYLTRPADASRPLPAVLFVQWLSCDSVRLPAEGRDGWALTLRALVERSGMVVARTEKPGVGASGGPPCDHLGYREELAAHRAALAALRRQPGVDPDSIYLFGASMGGTMVPLLAAGQDLRGVIVWGSTGLSWFEHMLALDRRVLALRGTSATEIDRLYADQVRVQAGFLLEGRSPTALASDPTLAAAWRRILGSSPSSLYGRPFAFHQEAQRAEWQTAWRSLRAPVLVLRGEYDWIMGEEDHGRIAQLVDGAGGTVDYRVVPGMDHNFSVFTTPDAAFRGDGGVASSGAIDVIMPWLDSLRGNRIGSRWSPPSQGERGHRNLDGLEAPAPDSSLHAPLMDFGQFVGTWDLAVTYYRDTGPETYSGEWQFGWILDGRAIQDVWRVPAGGAPGPLRGFGTTVRLFDPSVNAWRCTWHGALNGSVTRFLARRQGNEIVLEPDAPQEERFRWVFFDVAATTFRWRAESSSDGGKSWTVQQEMHARRRAGSAG